MGKNYYSVATEREVNRFMQRYCKNESSRLRISKWFLVDAEVYEDLAPGQKVYSWICGGKLIGESIMTLKVKDFAHMKIYYPIFPADMGSKLLRSWKIAMPPKWSVFADSYRHENVEAINLEMRHLLVYARLFISMQRKSSCAMPYGFKEIYLQLHTFPDHTVDASVIMLVNNILGQYLHLDGNCINWENLQEFITYLHSKYTMLKFVDADFSGLRQIYQQQDTEEPCYF